MDVKTSSSQPIAAEICSNAISLEVIPDDDKEKAANEDSIVLFSGIGEETSFLSATANSRASSLKYEGDCFILEALFTSLDYKNLSSEQVIESVIPLIEKYDISYLWSIFKSIVEKRMASLSREKMISETEWLRDPTIRLAKILCFLPMKKMPSIVLGSLDSDLSKDKHQECMFLDSPQESTNASDSSFQLDESAKVEDTNSNRHDIVKLLSKIDELQYRTACLNDENTQVQDMLVDAGRKLKIASEENLQLKHQLIRAKVNVKEIDDLTSEVWSLKSKLTRFECIEKTKQKKLKEIEEQEVILFRRVQDLEGKIHYWHAIVEDTKNELNALKNLVCAQEERLVLAVQETTLTEFQLKELIQVKTDLEISIKELLDANDALRSDKRVLENNLAEMEFMLSNKDGSEMMSSLGCDNILCEEDSVVLDDEGFSSSRDNHLNSFSTEERSSRERLKYGSL